MEKSLASHKLVTDAAGLAEAAKTLEGAEFIGVDLETTGLNPRDGRMRLLQLATPAETFVVDAFEVADLSPLKELLESGPVKILQNCVPLDTDVLTPLGWKPIFMIRRGDTVMGYKNGEQKWTRVTEYVNGGVQEVIESGNSRRRWRSTANHRWVCERRYGSRARLRREEYLTTRGLSEGVTNSVCVKHSAPFVNPTPGEVSEEEASLLAWLWGDGHVGGRQCSITQSENNRDYCEKIEGLLDSLGIERRFTRLPESPHIRRYYVPPRFVRSVYAKTGLALDSPDYEAFVLGLSFEALESWFEHFWYAEGSKSRPFPQVVCQTRKANPGKYEALLLAGHLLGYTPIPGEPDFLSFGRPYTTLRKVSHVSIGYEMVACLTTETSNFVMRQGDFVTITGNSKFDYAFLWDQHGISLSPIFDTMLAAQLLAGGDQSPSFSLEAISERYVGVELDKEVRRQDWSGKLSGEQLEYAARDAAVLLPLREKLAGELEEDSLGYVSGIEFGAVATISEMELAGVKLDVPRWKELEHVVRQRRDAKALELEAQFPQPEGVLPLEGLGPSLNLNSPKQITDAFRSLGIELSDTKVWTLLKVDHPAAKLLLEYRELQKKLGTYLETYPKFVSEKTGRIHANFLQCRVPTGRLACVAEGTLVEVARDQSKDFGGIPVERVKAGDLAYTYDEDRRLTLRKVLWAGKTGHRKVLSVRWRSGSHKREGVLELTPDHEVRLASGEYVRAENLKPGDRVLALGRDMTGWGYSRIYATGYARPIREHRFVFEAANGSLPEHVHHADGNKLNNVPGNLVGMTNSEHTRHHVATRMDEAERERLAKIVRESWVRDRTARLRAVKRGDQNHNWLGLEKEWMEEVLWENAGKPTAFRDVYGIDYETAQRYLEMHGIDWRAIAEHFTSRGERIDRIFYRRTRDRVRELGFNAGLRTLGIGSRKWKKIKAHFEGEYAGSNNHEILSVEYTGRVVDVYDMEVEGTHNFIAGEICVHNCTSPNIQQIPHEDEFRRCFVAEEGNVLVIADYSQVELRILAEVSGDPAFVEAFQRGDDLHRVTAATMYGVAMEDVTKDQRSDAKRINFGLMYGRGARSLSAQLGTDEERGRQLIDEYFANYPKVQRFLQRTANRAVRDRTLRTLAGRLRKFGPASGLDDRGAMRREAMNFPIQGASADIAKLALVYIREELRGLDARLVNCVHDEFVVECALGIASQVEEKTRAAMVRAGEEILEKVPVEVEVVTSPEWRK